MDPQQRKQAIQGEILEGNLPTFLRKLITVQLKHVRANGRTLIATVFVIPDYLAIGSDKYFLRSTFAFAWRSAASRCCLAFSS